MPFARPTLTAIVERIRNDLKSRAKGGDAWLRRTFEHALAWALGGVSHEMHGHLAWIADQAIPDKAELAQLLRHARIFSIFQKPATPAHRTMTFTGVNGTSLPAGTLVQTSDGTQFSADADGTVSAGSVAIAFTALIAGVDGNIDVGTPVKLVSPITGLSPNGIVTSAGVNGTEVEQRDSVLSRYLARVRTPPRGGGPGDYVAWAREVAGVTRAWEYTPMSSVSPTKPGIVTLTFVVDADPSSIIPSPSKVAEVQTYIDKHRPVTVKQFTVFAPTEYPLVLSIQLTIESTATLAAVKTAIEQQIADLVKREAEPGKVLPLSHIREAISIAAGEYDHTLIAPVANVNPGEFGLVTFDPADITWS